MSYFRITENLSFNDVEESDPRKVVDIQLRSWVFNPADLILKSSNTDNYMAALLVMLVYFEVHAQYIQGKSSRNQSKFFFNYSFKKFLDQSIESIPVCFNFYTFARCGLFHSLHLTDGILVDAVDYTDGKMFKTYNYNNTKKLIVNVEAFFSNLIKFHESFIKNDITKEFKSTYERLILNPIREFKVK